MNGIITDIYVDSARLQPGNFYGQFYFITCSPLNMQHLYNSYQRCFTISAHVVTSGKCCTNFAWLYMVERREYILQHFDVQIDAYDINCISYRNFKFHTCTLEKEITTQKEITSQTDKYVVILSSKSYVFEDKLTTYFWQCKTATFVSTPSL